MYSKAPCKACNDKDTQERLGRYDAFLYDEYQYVMWKDNVAAAEVPGLDTAAQVRGSFCR